MSAPRKKILFLVPYPLHRAPSQRFRVELYLPLFSQRNLDYHIEPFLDEESFGILYAKGSALKKAAGVMKGFLRRFATMFRLRQYDYIFIHREASPVGPPVFEWLIAKVFRKKYIFDFDDAIWIPDGDRPILNRLKGVWKTKYLCKWGYKVSAGNHYLLSYARQFNPSLELLPTCVDVINHHNQTKEQHTTRPVIGWTGSHSTLKYLDPILPVLQELASTGAVDVLVICNKKPDFDFPNFRFIPWNEKTEVEDLMKINIGVMPLVEDKWSEGKCGFKLIQYLSLGIPAVASPVGVNKEIIENGQNGFLCSTANEWKEALEFLIKDEAKRREFGRKGQAKIHEQYSIQVNEGRFFSLFT